MKGDHVECIERTAANPAYKSNGIWVENLGQDFENFGIRVRFKYLLAN